MKPTGRWRDKFRDAFDGIWRGVHEESSCRVHAVMTVAVISLAVFFRCDRWEWCLLLLCIGAVWTAEIFNSAVETLFRGLPAEARDQVYPCLHMAAGAVLMMSSSSAVIGLIIFWPYIAALLF